MTQNNKNIVQVLLFTVLFLGAFFLYQSLEVKEFGTGIKTADTISSSTLDVQITDNTQTKTLIDTQQVSSDADAATTTKNVLPTTTPVISTLSVTKTPTESIQNEFELPRMEVDKKEISIPFTVKDNPVLDATYSQYFKMANEQVEDYKIKIAEITQPAGDFSIYSVSLEIENVKSTKKGGFGFMNITCTDGVEAKMIFSGDVCKKKAGPFTNFLRDEGTQNVHGEQGLTVYGAGVIYLEIFASYPPEGSGDTSYTPEIILHKGISFNVGN